MEFNKKSKQKAEYLFVYGTLKPEMIESVMPQLLPYFEFVANGYVTGKLFDVNDYPGAVPATSVHNKIFGQLLSIHRGFEKEVFHLLDDYEDYDTANVVGSLFRREKVTVYINEAHMQEAWIYWYNKSTSGLTEIISGVYSKE